MTKRLRSIALLLLPALLLAAPAHGAGGGDRSGSVAGLRLEGRAGRTELTVEVTGGQVRWTDFSLSGPPRVVVDIQDATSGLDPRYEGIRRGGVVAVRTSQHTPGTVRIVVDLERDAAYEVEEVEGGLRISLVTGAQAFQPWTSGPARQAGAAPRRPSGASPPAAQPQRSQARRITVTFENTDMRDVLASFQQIAGRSIVPGAEVGAIRVDYVAFDNEPWDEALRALLASYGLAAEETPGGIIRVDRIDRLAAQAQNEPLVTRTFRINYVPAEEVRGTLEPLVSERGSVSSNQATNTVVVTDVSSSVTNLAALIQDLDVRTPQVSIQAKIIFINRTEAEDLGIVYDLKDSRGNSLNQIVSVPDPNSEDGELTNDDLISLGGNSIAALGNANNRVSNPALETVISLVLGRYTLITFLDALQTAELSDIQAAPSVTVANNHEAEIWVGERTPLRVVDLGGGGLGGGGGVGGGGAGQVNVPRATTELVETGIRLRVKPQVTDDRHVLLTLHAERSSAQVVATEIGVLFQNQQGDTRVMVRDGETAVIGGLTVTEVTSTRTGIPFLMDVPYLGSLFRRTNQREVKRDLLIMVTPHIVDEGPALR